MCMSAKTGKHLFEISEENEKIFKYDSQEKQYILLINLNTWCCSSNFSLQSFFILTKKINYE